MSKPRHEITLFVEDDPDKAYEEALRLFLNDSTKKQLISLLDPAKIPAVFEDNEEFRKLFLNSHGQDDLRVLTAKALDGGIDVFFKPSKGFLPVCFGNTKPWANAQPERDVVAEEEPEQAELPPPPLDDLRHFLQTRFPVLYAEVLQPTLADLRQEYSATLPEEGPWKARCVLLQGSGALAAAAICQLGFSLLGRIAALWKARSPK